jgi:hypothetical protein
MQMLKLDCQYGFVFTTHFSRTQRWRYKTGNYIFTNRCFLFIWELGLWWTMNRKGRERNCCSPWRYYCTILTKILKKTTKVLCLGLIRPESEADCWYCDSPRRVLTQGPVTRRFVLCCIAVNGPIKTTTVQWRPILRPLVYRARQVLTCWFCK